MRWLHINQSACAQLAWTVENSGRAVSFGVVHTAWFAHYIVMVHILGLGKFNSCEGLAVVPAATEAACRLSGSGSADCKCSCTTWAPAAWSAGTRGQGPRVMPDRSTTPGGAAAGAPLAGGLPGVSGGYSRGVPISCNSCTCDD